ncbi:hypothetical protein ACWEPR_39260, partial [Streptomyces sp. NPDC004290]
MRFDISDPAVLGRFSEVDRAFEAGLGTPAHSATVVRRHRSRLPVVITSRIVSESRLHPAQC